MRRLNRSRAEIEQYYRVPRYRNEQDFIRGRLNYVGGRELWQERSLRLQEEADLQRVYAEQNMARFNDYYSSRGRGRGRSRGRGFIGRGRGRAPVHREQRAPQQGYTDDRNIGGRGIRPVRDGGDDRGERGSNPGRNPDGRGDGTGRGGDSSRRPNVLETRINETTEENIETQNQGAVGNGTENATRESNEIGRNNGTGGNNRPRRLIETTEVKRPELQPQGSQLQK